MFLILLGVLCAVLVGSSFMIAGTPVSQRSLNFDKIRMSNFSDLKYKIETFYRNNKRLPASLQEITVINNSPISITTDPETKQQYTYMATGTNGYSLCTIFSTDSQQTVNEDYIYSYNENVNLRHIKGYDCIEYILPSHLLITPTRYIYRGTPTPTPTTPYYIPTPTYPPLN